VCTLVILHRPQHPWPLIVGANRDEMRDRAAAPPGRHWDDRPEVVAGLDCLGGGSWLGVNDHGMVAAVMNRAGTLGPQVGKRSRGELVLEALDHAEAGEAARALTHLDPAAYRSFNVFVGDPGSAFWLRGRDRDGPAAIELLKVPPGLHMLTAHELDDNRDARIRTYFSQFLDARVPEPDDGNWKEWQSLLASRIYPSADGPAAAMNVELSDGFGTVSSHLVAIPRHPGFERKPVFLFADGPPDQARFEQVAI
jgi:uncharacterized protein with NRDE domain